MRTTNLILILITLFLFNIVVGQDSDEYDNLMELSLDDLLNMELTIASKKALNLRESPGIISVITQEDIENSGARDLVDVLKLVPGMFFGVDVQGIVGIGMRGNWGHEGKILLMIDGLEMNELAYSTLIFGHHYDVNQIKRIEIIRGPGSSIYGGYAELGVINIITKSVEDMDGGYVAANYGQMENDLGRYGLSVGYGKKLQDTEISALGYYGYGNRSDIDFVDIYGDEFDMTDGGSEFKPMNVNIGLKHKGLQARVIYDHLSSSTVSMFDAGLVPHYEQEFTTINSMVIYDYEYSKKLSFSPSVSFAKMEPWNSESDFLPYDISISQIIGKFSTNYDYNKDLNVNAGIEYRFVNAGLENESFYNNKDKFDFNILTAYFQSLYQSELANITIGGRIDKHSEVDIAFSPRIGITKVIDKFHMKLLYSQAFRSPGVENMNSALEFVNQQPVSSAPDITPEKTQVTEIEAGYKITPKLSAFINAFNIVISDPILYTYIVDDEGNEIEGYYNAKKSGTRGVEIETRYKGSKSNFTASYSYYTADGINETDYYQVPGETGSLLGAPNHKISFNGSYRLYKNINLSPSFVWYSKVYAYNKLDADEVEVINEFDSQLLLNLFLTYNNIADSNIDVGFGVYDVFANHEIFYQPYNGWHSPLPGPSREMIFKINYRF